MSDSASRSKQEEALPPLSHRIGVECIAAVVSALSVAPVISIVDKAIVSNASGLEPLIPCAINGIKTMFLNPIYFFREPSFLLIWAVYSGTYIAANSVEAMCQYQNRPALYPKFFASSGANVMLSVWKDETFARMFGVGEVKPLPGRCYGLFATRDSMTIFASFTLPGPISVMMQNKFACTPLFADNVSQLLSPCAMQFLSCPLHLHGLDLYNRRGPISVADRISFISREYYKTAFARIARILPAFGVGGILNKFLRKTGVEKLSDV